MYFFLYGTKNILINPAILDKCNQDRLKLLSLFIFSKDPLQELLREISCQMIQVKSGIVKNKIHN